MNVRMLYAKRIDHLTCEVFVQNGVDRSARHIINATDLLVAAARHTPAASFDAFYGALAKIGVCASLPDEGLDGVAADLGLNSRSE